MYAAVPAASLPRPKYVATSLRSLVLLASHLVQHRIAQSAETRSVRVQREYNHLIRSLLQKRRWHIERLLRSDIPEPPERMAVNPDRALAPSAQIEERVACSLQLEVALVKRRSGRAALRGYKLQVGEIVHGQGEHLPSRHFPARNGDGPVDPLPLRKQFPAEVDSASTFHKDVEQVSGFGLKLDAVLLLSAIGHAYKRRVQIDPGITAQRGQYQIARCWRLQPGAVQNVAVRLVKGFHVARLCCAHRIGQVRPKRSDLV